MDMFPGQVSDRAETCDKWVLNKEQVSVLVTDTVIKIHPRDEVLLEKCELCFHPTSTSVNCTMPHR